MRWSDLTIGKISLEGYILEADTGKKMGWMWRKERTRNDDSKVFGLNNWFLIVGKQISGEEIPDLFWTFWMWNGCYTQQVTVCWVGL